MYNKIVKLLFAVILITQPVLIAKENNKTTGRKLTKHRAKII